MQLTIATHHISGARLGNATTLSGGTMTVDRALAEQCAADLPAIASVAVDLVAPGESARVVHVLDTIEPRAKLSGGPGFPGLLGPPDTAGSGRTLRLAGLAVMAAARPPQPVSGLLQPREAIVDMSGPAAAYSPFARLHNLVLTFQPAAEASNADFDDAIRLATLRVAERLALAAAGEDPDEETSFTLADADPALPRVGYFYQLQSQGIYASTLLYGRPVENLVPTPIHPNEVLDGALVSGNYAYGCFKNPTYLHQNNPVLLDLYRRHGHELSFRAVVLARGHNYTQMEKERSANYAANLLQWLGVEAVVLTGEGGGNSAIDMMLTCRGLERRGIRTVVVSYELGGLDGTDFPLVDHVAEADAIISTGSVDKHVLLPAMDRAVGGATYLDTEIPASASTTVVLDRLYCSAGQLGAGLLTARPF